ncbi:hypothetical protein GCM10012275_28060 [Longimycelium tulufanense]|uniref:Uncharacterized protein n=1 Tax=Longimycelium tulufanense TaxID=907463 RepID=A0A8J3CCW3_9PSEU|nr:hypothetical protein GCM10012275_28060 [Longimycelium tulufanense]
MGQVTVTELDDLMVKLLVESGHREIDTIEIVPTSDRPDNHTRLVVQFANGSNVTIMVRQVVDNRGRTIPGDML